MTNLYDLTGINIFLKKSKNDKIKKEFINNKLRGIKEDSSLYNLNYVARITKIYRDAKRLFG